MDDLQAVLFPHTWISRFNIELIARLFGTFGVCQPWQTESFPASPEGTEDNVPARILRPPLEMKPEKKVASLLSGYEEWAGSTRVRSYASSLIAAESMATPEDHTWDIRKGILGKITPESERIQDRTLKWHLILHLARKLEETRSDIDEMLERISMEKQPLEGALEKASSDPGLFDDIPSPERRSTAGKYKPAPVIEAWLGLFEEHLKKIHVLITLDREIMDYVTSFHEDVFSGKLNSQSLTEIKLNLQDIVKSEAQGTPEPGRKYPFDEDLTSSLWKILSALDDQDVGQKENISRLTKEIEQRFSPSPDGKDIHMEINRLPTSFVRGRPLYKLGGRMIILVTPMGL